MESMEFTARMSRWPAWMANMVDTLGVDVGEAEENGGEAVQIVPVEG